MSNNYTFKMTAGDTSPVIEITCKNKDDNVVPVTGATNIVFEVWYQDKSSKIIDNNVNTSIVDGPNGVIDYTWQTGDTDTVGIYLSRFRVTFSDGSIETFPNAGRYIKTEFGV